MAVPPHVAPAGARKSDHLRIAAAPGVEHSGPTGLAAVRLRHRALPERDLGAVSLEPREGRAGEALATLVTQLRIATWAAGAPSTAALATDHLR
jgi:hypothetical protein